MYIRKMVFAFILCAALSFAAFFTSSVHAAGSTVIYVNNNLINLNTVPAYSGGVIMVPARELVQSLGGTFTYNNTLMTGTLKQGEQEIVFRLDNNIVKYNGKYVQSPAAMKIINMRFMIPAEFVTGLLGTEIYMNTGRNILMIFQPAGGKLIYRVMPGDTLWSISQLFGVPVASVKQLNVLSTDMIYSGQNLVIKYFVQPNNSFTAQTIKNATLMNGAGFDFSPAGYLTSWVNITVNGKNGDWYKVSTPRGAGYLHSSVVGITQTLRDDKPDTNYFDNEIPVDTSMDSVTYINYTVQKGDTLWSISEKYGLLYLELEQANNISSSNEMYPGQILKVPVHNIPVKAKLDAQSGEILDWFKEAQYLFSIGRTGKFTDIETGKSFMAERTMGANHSDTETVTAADTSIMKSIFGGNWNWTRRPFILETGGRRFAVSLAGMPHAGLDAVPFLENIGNRSGNTRYGPNYDRIKGNGMDGHFDVYFLNSFRHVDNTIDSGHQSNVLLSGGLR